MSEIVNYALTTLTKAKTHLGVSGTDDDVLLERIINAVTDYIEGECGRRFKETVYTQELYDGDDFGRWLFLKNFPVIELTKIEHTTNGGETWKEDIEGRDFEKYENDGAIYFYTKYSGKRNYRITYRAGYTTIPYDLEMLCIRLVARLYEKRRSEGKKSESLGPASIDWGEFLGEEDRKILNKYKKVSI